MNTQLRITVRNASFPNKFFTLLWFVNIFKTTKVQVWIDDPNSTPTVLKARKEPYEIPVEPGEHNVFFFDPDIKSRVRFNNLTKKMTLGVIGASAGLAMGSGVGAAAMAGAMSGGQRAVVKDNVLSCALADGDELAVTVKPKRSKVKITIDR
jgi:hypothetical protein